MTFCQVCTRGAVVHADLRQAWCQCPLIRRRQSTVDKQFSPVVNGATTAAQLLCCMKYICCLTSVNHLSLNADRMQFIWLGQSLLFTDFVCCNFCAKIFVQKFLYKLCIALQSFIHIQFQQLSTVDYLAIVSI